MAGHLVLLVGLEDDAKLVQVGQTVCVGKILLWSLLTSNLYSSLWFLTSNRGSPNDVDYWMDYNEIHSKHGRCFFHAVSDHNFASFEGITQTLPVLMSAALFSTSSKTTPLLGF